VRHSVRSEPATLSKVLSVSDLVKVYHDTIAVDGISFDVGSNEIVGPSWPR